MSTQATLLPEPPAEAKSGGGVVLQRLVLPSSLKPYYEQDGLTIYHANCLEIMGALNADAIVTDPPYALNYTPDTGGKVTGDTVRDFRRMLLKLPKAMAHTGATTLGLFTRWDIWRDVHDAFDKLWPPCAMVVWDKANHGRGNCNHFGQSHEIIYVSAPAGHVMRIGDKRPLNIVRCPILAAAKMVHTTQKPLEVMGYLVEALCPAEQTVLDPFMGSGSTLVASRALGRRAIGIDIEERNCEIAASRIAQGDLWRQNAGTDRRGRPVASELETDASRPRSVQ